MKRDYWNKLAETFETEVCDITAGAVSDRLDCLVKILLYGRPKDTLIDLGCGTGTFLGRYHHYFKKVIGIDYSNLILKKAIMANTKNKITYICDNIPVAARLYPSVANLTVCLNVITSHSVQQRVAIWNSIAHVTKNKGCAIVVVPSFESASFVEKTTGSALSFKNKKEKENKIILRDGVSQKHYSKTEALNALRSVGFNNVQIEPIYYTWELEGDIPLPLIPESKYPWDWMLSGIRNIDCDVNLL